MVKIIAVIPIYNEEKGITGCLNAIYKTFNILILVNDGSTDSSKKKVIDFIKNKKGIYFIDIKKNKGMAFALKQGFLRVIELLKQNRIRENDIILTIDADGQHEKKSIISLIKYFKQNDFDMVIAKRDFSNYPLYKIIGNRALSLFCSILSRFKFYDSECGLKALKASVIRKIMEYYTGYRYSCSLEIAIISGLLNFKINNKFPINVKTYIRGARLKDGISNLLFGLISFTRFKLGIKNEI